MLKIYIDSKQDWKVCGGGKILSINGYSVVRKHPECRKSLSCKMMASIWLRVCLFFQSSLSIFLGGEG